MTYPILTTVAAFAATGRDSADLGEEVGFDHGSATPIGGRIYAENLYIEDTSTWGDDRGERRAKWYLIVDREWFSDDLADLERRLFLYYLSEDKPSRDALVEDAINAAAKSIQDAIGQNAGDVAGHFFSGDAEGVRVALDNYIFSEIDYGT